MFNPMEDLGYAERIDSTLFARMEWDVVTKETWIRHLPTIGSNMALFDSARLYYRRNSIICDHVSI